MVVLAWHVQAVGVRAPIQEGRASGVRDAGKGMSMACRLYRRGECRYHIDTGAWAKYRMKPKRPLVVEHGAIGRAWADRDGWVHRRDGPALEWRDGAKEWWTHGYRNGYEDIGSGRQRRVGGPQG